MKIKILLLLAMFYAPNLWAQLNASLPHIHSHNDYLQSLPLLNALNAGAKSIEIDLHLKNGNLFVAHSKREIRDKNRLENLYILPLQNILEKNSHAHEFHLMVDIKTDAQTTLAALQKTLLKYPHIFSKNGIQVIISGNRPKPDNYSNYADFIWFDARSPEEIFGEKSHRIAIISQNLSKFTKWRGKGDIPKEDKLALENFINEAHKKNKPVRLWNSGDSKYMYQFLCEIGVDYINTDKPETLRNYLNAINNPIENE